MNFKEYWIENPEIDIYVKQMVFSYFELRRAGKKMTSIDNDSISKYSRELIVSNRFLNKHKEKKDIINTLDATIVDISKVLYDKYNKCMLDKQEFNLNLEYKIFKEKEKQKLDIIKNDYYKKQVIYNVDSGEFVVKGNSIEIERIKAENVNDLNPIQKNKLLIKGKNDNNIDFKLLSVICNVLGENAAKRYINELEKGIFGNKRKLGYSVVYDFKVEDNTQFSDKRKNNLYNSLKKQLKKSKKLIKIANLDKKNKNGLKRTIAGFSAGIFGFLGTIGFVNATSKDNNIEDLKLLNAALNYSDNDKGISDNNNEMKKEVFLSSIVVNNYKESNKMDVNYIHEESDTKLQEYLNLGQVIDVKSGLKYYENSRNIGNNGIVSETSYRKPGQYEVNGVSVLNEQNEIVDYIMMEDIEDNEQKYDIQEFIESKLPKGGRVSYHLNYIDNNEKKPTGWVNAEEINLMLQNKQQEKNINNELER